MRWRGRRIERSYENKAKPEGGVRYAHATIDTQDRRSNFRSCHSDASWRVPPRLLHAFTHTLADERSAEHAPSTERCPARCTSDVAARHDRAPASRTDAKRARDGCLPGYYARVHGTLGERTRNRIMIPRSSPYVPPDVPPFASDCFPNDPLASREISIARKR